MPHDSPWIRLREAIEADFVDSLERPVTLKMLSAVLVLSTTAVRRRIEDGTLVGHRTSAGWIIDVEASRAGIGAAMWRIPERRRLAKQERAPWGGSRSSIAEDR
ncbi:hypothetical protein ITJ66_16740 [Plantibacter sp. VKM Ac-2885]|uniref:hypothetical protein n=1 Tax=Plantibacter sp. VKM Ac-2885 TaxID=2783828 RepID=UPI00188C772B|nr:hypothetical protein [Plantibacter sp. VKM Ac-2885]MBF4514135.1 hypothetical protein [Plantibacter sp. VKM Ac-2885]